MSAIFTKPPLVTTRVRWFRWPPTRRWPKRKAQGAHLRAPAKGGRTHRRRHLGARQRHTEAASAATEMRKASDQIASGAEEAAGASQESLKAVNHGAGLILKAKENAETSVTKTEALKR